LVRDELIGPSLAPALQAMAGLRNILVHGYQQIDNDIVRDVVENHLQDLLQFVSALRVSLKK
jgi:uncharacterized protein YutE (UPF0331/DUF86 family)